jgi:hypothetical protein
MGVLFYLLGVTARWFDEVVVPLARRAATRAEPILRLSRFPTAAWLDAYEEVDAFRDALASGQARAADPRDVAAWIDFHENERSFLPRAVGFEELIARAEAAAIPAPLPCRALHALYAEDDLDAVDPASLIDCPALTRAKAA